MNTFKNDNDRKDNHNEQQAHAHENLCEPLWDSAQAAAILKIHPKTLQKMARSGEITGIRLGKLWRFRASALNEWLKKIAS